MARELGKLNSRKVETLKLPGRHSDGGNLYLSISDNGGKRWVFFYRFKGKRKEMGLGSATAGNVSLLDARREAAKARALVTEGIDPLEARVLACKLNALSPRSECLPMSTLQATAQNFAMTSISRNGK